MQTHSDWQSRAIRTGCRWATEFRWYVPLLAQLPFPPHIIKGKHLNRNALLSPDCNGQGRKAEEPPKRLHSGFAFGMVANRLDLVVEANIQMKLRYYITEGREKKKVICLAAEILRIWRDENFIICHGWSGWFPFGQLTVESVVMVLVEPRRMIWDSTNIIVFYSWMPEQHPVGWLHHQRIRIESFGWVWAFPLSG